MTRDRRPAVSAHGLGLTLGLAGLGLAGSPARAQETLPAPAPPTPVAPAPSAPFGPPPGPLRLSGGFGAGRLSAEADAADATRTGQASVEWLTGHDLRAGLAWRTVGRELRRACPPDAASATPGRCPQSGATGRSTHHTFGFTVGLARPFFAISGGGAWHFERTLEPDGGVRASHALRPAGHLRLGPPDAVCLRAAAWDAGPETPGAGTLRAGVEFTPGAGRVLVGAVRESPSWGLLLAGQVPMGAHAALAVSGASHPTAPARLVLLSVGVVVGFDPLAP